MPNAPRRPAVIALAVVAAAVALGAVGCGSTSGRHGAAAPPPGVSAVPKSPVTPGGTPGPAPGSSAPLQPTPAARPTAGAPAISPSAVAGSPRPRIAAASSVPTAPPSTGSPAPAGAARPAHVEARLTGLPTVLGVGAAPVEFSAVLTDDTGGAVPSVSPLFQLAGSAGSTVTTTVERLDPSTGRWVSAPASDDGSAPVGAVGTTPYSIPAGGSLTIRYRISVSAGSQPQDLQTYFYLVGADGSQLATASQSLRVAAA